MELLAWILFGFIAWVVFRWATSPGYDYNPPRTPPYRRYEATMEAIVEKYPNGVVKSIDDGISITYFDPEGNFSRQVDKKSNQIVKKNKVEV